MESKGLVSMILRFRDIGYVQGHYVNSAHDIISSKGHVWWAWINKTSEQIPEDAFRELIQKIDKNGFIEIYLFDSGEGHNIYKVKCDKIKWENDLKHFVIDEVDHTIDPDPSFKALTWFRFTKVDKSPIVFDELRRFSYVKANGFFIHNESDSLFSPYYNKQVVSNQELAFQNRTIHFLRFFQDGDSTQEILIDIPHSRPQNFYSDYYRTGKTSLLWLSDLHFTEDKKGAETIHAFPFVSTHGEYSLSDALGNVLEKEKIAGAIVSGDITWKGTEKEFQLATKSLLEIRRWSGIDKFQVTICPGNHDIPFVDDPALEGSTINVTESEEKKQFISFYNKFFNISPNEFLCSGRKFLLKGYIPVEIACLNSSLLKQTEDVFQGQGYLGKDQLNHVKKEMGWEDVVIEGIKPLRIVVLHHHLVPVTFREIPKVGSKPSVVYDAGALSEWIVECNISVVLHGHMHKPFLVKISQPKRPGPNLYEYYVCGMGSSGVSRDFLGESHYNTYGIITFKSNNISISIFGISSQNPDLGEKVWELKIPYSDSMFFET